MSCTCFIKLEHPTHTLKKSRIVLVLKNVNLNINVEGPVISCFKKILLKFSAMTEIAASSFSKSKLENAFFITNLKSLYLIVTMLNAIKDCRSF